MGKFNKTLAALAFTATTLFGGSAMAQEATEAPKPQVFTAEEVISVTASFNLRNCTMKAENAVHEKYKVGKLTDGQAWAEYDKKIDQCEKAIGMTMDESADLSKALVEKYGEVGLDRVLIESRPLFTHPAPY